MKCRGYVDGSGRSFAVVDLVCWLRTQGSPAGLNIVRALLCWLTWLVEHGPLWEEASEDALLNAPVARGPQRARRLDRALLHACAQESASGAWARTHGRLLWAMARFRKWRKPKIQAISLRQTVAIELDAYQRNGRELLALDREPAVALACDGTRLGKRDVLVSALWGARSQRAVWCPPLVCSGMHGE